MKYSLILPYFNRPDHLYNTLLSYQHHYADRADYEVLIVEDLAAKDGELVSVLDGFRGLNILSFLSPVANGVNPVIARNAAVLRASGMYVVNTNPECYHKSNVLAGFDAHLSAGAPDGWGPGHPNWNTPSFKNRLNRGKDVYIVGSCANVVFGGRAESFDALGRAKHQLWFDHPNHNSRRLHWCSCIARRMYMAIGGFDEQYHNLCGYDDDDFVAKIVNTKITIIQDPDIVVCHIDHDRSHQNESLRKMSLAYYQKKWVL